MTNQLINAIELPLKDADVINENGLIGEERFQLPRKTEKAFIIPLKKGDERRTIWIPMSASRIENGIIKVAAWLLNPDKDLPRLRSNGWTPVTGAFPAPASQNAPTAPANGHNGRDLEIGAVQKGYFTVESRDGDHRTYRIKESQGKTVVALMTGTSNTSDYTAFGFLDGRTLKFWNRCTFDRAMLTADFNAILQNPEDAGLLYARESKRCMRCNKMLTTPDSLNDGIGPECIKMGFGAPRRC